jgi:hypothetical protein
MTTVAEKAAGIDKTPYARLEQEGRLFNPILKGPTKKKGRYGFRGDIALKFQVALADEKRPPEYSFELVITVADENDKTIPVLAGYIHTFEWLKDVREVLGDLLTPSGTYLIFINNIDLLAKYECTIDGVKFICLPCDESTVWKETMDLLSIDKNDLKKNDTAGNLDYVLDKLRGFDDGYQKITYEEGLGLMEPVKNRNENRPV